MGRQSGSRSRGGGGGGGAGARRSTRNTTRGGGGGRGKGAVDVDEEEDHSFHPPPTPGARAPSPEEEDDDDDDDDDTSVLKPVAEEDEDGSDEEEESDEDADAEEEEEEEFGSRKKGPKTSSARSANRSRRKATLDDDSDAEDNERAGRRSSALASAAAKSKSKAGGKRIESKKTANSKKLDVRAGVTLTNKDMVHNGLLYFLLMQHKKLPVKRSEVVKHAMNDQTKSFSEVIKELDTVFEQVLGMKILGLEASAKTGAFSSYIVVSKYNLSVSDIIITERNADIDYRRTILFLILAVSFMLNRAVEEDSIWKIITELGLHEPTEPLHESMDVPDAEFPDDEPQPGVSTHINYVTKRDDLGRFLKREYVSTLYLQCDTEQTLVRYSWGQRAEKEYSKYSILKFVSKYFPGKKPNDFMDQYNIATEEEREAVEADAALDEQVNADLDEEREALAQALGLDISAIPHEDSIARSLRQGFDDDQDTSKGRHGGRNSRRAELESEDSGEMRKRSPGKTVEVDEGGTEDSRGGRRGPRSQVVRGRGAVPVPVAGARGKASVSTSTSSGVTSSRGRKSVTDSGRGRRTLNTILSDDDDVDVEEVEDDGEETEEHETLENDSDDEPVTVTAAVRKDSSLEYPPTPGTSLRPRRKAAPAAMGEQAKRQPEKKQRRSNRQQLLLSEDDDD